MTEFTNEQIHDLFSTAVLCDLLGPVSHEIQNHLNGIVLHAGLAARKTDDATRERVQKIRELAMQAGQLLHRLDEHRHEIDYPPENVDLRDLLDTTIAGAQTKCDIELTLPETPIVVSCHTTGLKRLLWMLLRNADDSSTSNRESTISIRLVEQAEEILLTVEDRGSPVAEEVSSILDTLDPTRQGAKPCWLPACLSLAKRLGVDLTAMESGTNGLVLALRLERAK